MVLGKNRLNEKGATLVLALLFLLILTSLGLAIVLNSQIDHAISKNYSKTIRATFAAQTGIERIKPYLLYDLQRDPAGWRNNLLWVPDGTAGASQGGTSPCIGVPPTSDCFELDDPSLVPSLEPYDVVDALADAQTNAVWAPENAAGWGTYGYQLMFRNLSSSGVGFDRNKICVAAGGFSDSTIGLMGTPSRGSDLVENCIIGEDISIWNNIVFFEGGATSGMGNFKIHGNVHILGPPKPPPSSTINLEVKGNQGWYNDYTSGTPITSTLSAVLDPVEAARTSLDAKIRDKNGLIDAQNGSVEFGTSAIPYDAVFGCDDCSGVFGFTSFASSLVRTQEMGPYDVPASVLAKIKVPLLTDQYKDERDVLYPNYEGYLIGVANAGGISGNHLPGVLGLKLSSLNMPGNRMVNFGDATTSNSGSPANRGSLADFLADDNSEVDKIIKNNIYDAALHPEQQPRDNITESGLTDPLFITAGTAIDAGSTFTLVAWDEADDDVGIFYKEVQPFDRSVDKDLAGPGGFSSLHTSRQVHGFVFARAGALNISTLNFKVDLDGTGGYNPTLTEIGSAESQKLLRKAVNALIMASQGTCMVDSSDPCWTLAPDNAFLDEVPPNMKSGINFNATDGPKLVGAGVIQMTDQFKFGSLPSTLQGLRYAGRFSLFTEETGGASGATNSGYTDIDGGPRPVPAYQAPLGTGPWFSFPCQTSMGIMAARRIDMGDPSGTHDEFAGAFYAYELLSVQKQIQILGAVVAQDFDLAGGGNPDWFQAMQISGCLPPEMIGKEPIIYMRSQSYSDR